MDLVAYYSSNADAARIGQCLQPRGNVDAITINVAAVDDHGTAIDADPQGNTTVLGCLGIAVDHRPLHLNGTAHGIDDTRKFDQHTVAGRLENAAMVLPDLRIDKGAAILLETLVCPFLVRSHQPRITRHIGSEDRRKTAFYGLLHGLPQPVRAWHSRNCGQK